MLHLIQRQIINPGQEVTEGRPLTETTSRIIPNPKDQSQLLVQHQGALYLMEAGTMKVRELRDPRVKADGERKIQVPTQFEGAVEGVTEQPGAVQGQVFEPIWSPNGDKIAFLSIRSSVESNTLDVQTLWVYDVATGRQIRVREQNLLSVTPHAWVGNDSLLITQYTRLNNETVPTIAVFDTNQRVSRDLEKGHFLAISADGKIVLYGKQAQMDASTVDMHIVDVESGSSAPLLATPYRQPLSIVKEMV